MHETPAETDLLIVGAGPVGLLLANECARRGLRYRIVEARSSQSTQSKALAIFPRTLEILDMAGLIEPFLDRANRVSSVAIASHERALAKMPFVPQESPHPFIAMVPQNLTEQILLDKLQRAGGAVEYETTFRSAVERDERVCVALERRGESLDVSAAFVIGCDGAHSAVRHHLQLPFAGRQYEDAFMLADIQTNDALPADELQLCPNESGPLAIFPMSARRRRIVAIVKHPQTDAPSLQLVRSLLAQRAPPGLEARGMLWSSYFRVHHRHVAQMRVGRVFIAGDAAHIHSPFGGQGMNTGLHDVWNLAWKLDLAVRGHGSEGLLDSYSVERLPIIRNVLRTTDLLTKGMGAPTHLAQVLRDTLIPAVSRLAPFQHAFVKRLSGLGIAYAGSPIVEGRGERYLDGSMRGGKGICSRFLLLHDGAAGRGAIERIAEAFGTVVEERITQSPQTLLVRPDGYIAWAARSAAAATELTSVLSLLELQTLRPAVTAPYAASSYG